VIQAHRHLYLLLVVLVVAALLAAAWVNGRYRHDLEAARDRVAAGGRVARTACGPIQYEAFGRGPAVLMVHGAGGGYDQGVLFARLVGEEFRWIMPSRFGYLGTPAPEDPSVEAQADAHACLLDALEIHSVAVVGVSAGGPSSLQFALRHPERTRALVMMSAVSRADPPRPRLADRALGWVLTTDFPYWLAMTAFEPTLTSVLGITQDVQAGLSARDAAFVSDALVTMLPVSLRRDGILLDMSLPGAVNDWPLQDVAAPTLVVHARDDALVRFHHAEHTAAAIPGARTVFLSEGGHFGYTFGSSAMEQVAAFVRAAGAGNTGRQVP